MKDLDKWDGKPCLEDLKELGPFAVKSSERLRREQERQEIIDEHKANERTAIFSARTALTDTGNAERFAWKYRGEFLYCHPWNKWLHWTGTHWSEDREGRTLKSTKAIPRMIDAALEIVGEDRCKDFRSWATRSESKEKRKAMLELASSEPGMSVIPHKLDSDPWLLNCHNGTLDLRTAEIREHDPSDLITRCLSTGYYVGAKCPGWLAFLHEVFAADKTVIDFIQRALGYALTGSTMEQRMFVLYGTGQNGKSTMMGVIQDLMEDYAKQAAPGLLLKKRNETHPTELADLRGARLVISIEADEGRRLHEELVKQMTGGDRIKARKMREDFWEFTPEFKLFLATNHRPEIRGTDLAIWRRLHLVPFAVTIPEDRKDPKLRERLKTESEGILAWVVRGCLAWQRDDLSPPSKIVDATEDYRKDMDLLADFIDERCLKSADVKVAAGQLYKVYRQWCEDAGIPPCSQKRFGLAITERGFSKTRLNSGNTYHGIGLLQDHPV